MILILLAILKYIAVILCILFAAFMLALVLVLFCPLTYSAQGHGAKARLKVNWMFGAVSFRAGYMKRQFNYDLVFFGKRRDGASEDSGENEKEAKKPHRRRKLFLRREKTGNSSKTENTEKKKPRTGIFGKKGFKKSGAIKRGLLKRKTENSENGEEQHGFGALINLIKTAGNHPDRKIITKKTILLLKRLYRTLKPKHFKMRGEVGFKNPDRTGKFIAAQAVCKAYTGLDILVYGNFERRVLKLDFDMYGKTCFYSLVYPLAVYVFSKPVWKIVKEYFAGNDEAKSAQNSGNGSISS
ncbi:MAG: hypothetical protein LBS21_02340 [Clostridiales bacterium]|nr:hypothetical protein [Clostridiales bacterium]